MNINTKSWHCRLVKLIGTATADEIKTGTSVSLCRYFWAVVGRLVLLLLVLAVAVVVVVEFVRDWPKSGIEFGIGIGGGILLALAAYGVTAIPRSVRSIIESAEHGLVWSFVVAAKRRVCPLITFTEDEQP